MRSITLIVSGGIAAYKALELIRLLKKSGTAVTPVLTRSAHEFVTPLSVAALAENEVRSELFALDEETKIGHIALSRASDLVVVAPASADILARMAQGRADDLATTLLLASNRPVLVAPAMNPEMWRNKATQANVETLKARGVLFVGPASGEAACGEEGMGRMEEPEEIFAAIQKQFEKPGPLKGKTALVTAGPTHEPIDPVRYIGNRSSGKQGYALAEALYDAGADVTLVSGPVSIREPQGVRCIRVQTAQEMLEACMGALPADIAIGAAAVADWRVKASDQKIKKSDGMPALQLEANPDILLSLSSSGNRRPSFLMGFAAETENLEASAREKLTRKNLDALIANDVSKGVFGADENQVTAFWRGKDKAIRMEALPRMQKTALAKLLVREIAQRLNSAA